MAPLVAEGRLGRGWSSLGYGAVEKAVEKEALPSRRNGPMCSTKKGGWMRFLLEDSVDVSCSFEAVRERFVGEEAWFAQLASAAEDEGEALLKIGPSWASGRVAREVRVTLGPPRDRGVTLVLPISWQSSELPGLFPVLEGEVELLALDSGRCRVSLFVSYVPPFGQLGGYLDRALLHRVAWSTLRSFLVRLAESLEQEGLAVDPWRRASEHLEPKRLDTPRPTRATVG